MRSNGLRTLADIDRQKRVAAVLLWMQKQTNPITHADLLDNCAARCGTPRMVELTVAWMARHTLIDVLPDAHRGPLAGRKVVYRLTEQGAMRAAEILAEKQTARAS